MSPELRAKAEKQTQQLLTEVNEADLARVQTSLEDVMTGRVKKFKTVDDLLKALEAEEIV
jgi:hypothetical protein